MAEVRCGDTKDESTPPPFIRDQTYLSVMYATKVITCYSCQRGILPHNLKLGYVRRVWQVWQKFPSMKTHWYHPTCLSVSVVQLVQQFGSQPLLRIDGIEALEKPHQDLLLQLVGQMVQSEGPREAQHRMNYPAVFHEQGNRSVKKRKRSTGHDDDDDSDYLPHNSSFQKAKTRFAQACRLSVSTLIQEFKQHYFTEHANADGLVSCQLTGKLISIAECHVDHAPPHLFHIIVDRFIQQQKQTQCQFMKKVEYVYGHFFDHRLISSFQQIHDELATLRIVSAHANLTNCKKHKSTE